MRPKTCMDHVHPHAGRPLEYVAPPPSHTHTLSLCKALHPTQRPLSHMVAPTFHILPPHGCSAFEAGLGPEALKAPHRLHRPLPPALDPLPLAALPPRPLAALARPIFPCRVRPAFLPAGAEGARGVSCRIGRKSPAVLPHTHAPHRKTRRHLVLDLLLLPSQRALIVQDENSKCR